MSKQSKIVAVSAAVANQLHHEGRWPPNDLTKVMRDDYGYSIQTISNFLTAVSWNLAHGNPSHLFSWDQPFAQAALSDTVAGLIGDIDAKTI